MSSSRPFAIMSLHAGQKNYHEVCINYLSHSAISSIDSGKGSLTHVDGRVYPKSDYINDSLNIL